MTDMADDIDRLLHALDLVEDYVGHRSSCTYRRGMSNPDGDICTCGVGDVIEEVDEIVREVRGNN